MLTDVQNLTRQQRKEQTRTGLLAAARRVIAARGLSATTTREITTEAGVAAGTFFVHFPDMNTLVETLLDEHIGAALDDALAHPPENTDLVGELVHVARALYESYDSEPELARQYLSASLFHANPHGPAERRIQQFETWVIERVTHAMVTRSVAVIDARLVFPAYFSLYFGLLVAGLRGQLTRSEQLDVLESSLRRILRAER